STPTRESASVCFISEMSARRASGESRASSRSLRDSRRLSNTEMKALAAGRGLVHLYTSNWRNDTGLARTLPVVLHRTGAVVLEPLLVAISSTAREDGGTRRVRVNEAYVRSVEAAGMVPLVIPPFTDVAAVDHVLDAVSALVMTGGEDVDPSRYNAVPHPALGFINPLRDSTEIALVLAAKARRMPTLAICRGIQIANVALGGTLI